MAPPSSLDHWDQLPGQHALLDLFCVCLGKRRFKRVSPLLDMSPPSALVLFFADLGMGHSVPAKQTVNWGISVSFLLACTSFYEWFSWPLFPLAWRMGTFYTSSISELIVRDGAGQEECNFSIPFLYLLLSPQDSIYMGRQRWGSEVVAVGAVLLTRYLSVSQQQVSAENGSSSVFTSALSFHSRKENEVPSMP